MNKLQCLLLEEKKKQLAFIKYIRCNIPFS